MPEGPEVRTVSDKLRPYLIGRVISGSYFGERAKTIGFHNLKYPSGIIGVRSHGKKVIIDLNTCHMIIVSLGMTGRLQYTQGDHSHVRFDISNIELQGSFRVMKQVFSLYFDDYRYMGSVDIIPNGGIPLYFRDMGPDLLQLSIDENTWISPNTWLIIFTQKKLLKRFICDVLLDQSLIAGIGLYLVTEILYYSMIYPKRIVGSITVEEWERIRINSHKVINLSYSYGGFTIRDFISPTGERGLYPSVIYGKTHDPNGYPIIDEKHKGRTLHFVPQLQH
jgi:formamidopyrimidine-DNA glycosylase